MWSACRCDAVAREPLTHRAVVHHDEEWGRPQGNAHRCDDHGIRASRGVEPRRGVKADAGDGTHTFHQAPLHGKAGTPDHEDDRGDGGDGQQETQDLQAQNDQECKERNLEHGCSSECS